jgi:hypothetical protein
VVAPQLCAVQRLLRFAPEIDFLFRYIDPIAMVFYI